VREGYFEETGHFAVEGGGLLQFVFEVDDDTAEVLVRFETFVDFVEIADELVDGLVEFLGFA